MSRYQISINQSSYQALNLDTGIIDFVSNDIGILLNSCITNMINGGKIKILQGTYNLSTTVNVNINYVTIEGEIKNNTIIQCMDSSIDMFMVSQGFNEFYNISLTSTVSRINGYAINQTHNPINMVCQNIHVSKMYNCINASSNGCFISHVDIDSFTNYGIFVGQGNTEQRLEFLEINNIQNNPQQGIGLEIQSTGSLLISNCDIVACDVDLDLNPAINISISAIYVINSYFDSANFSCKFEGQGTIQYCKFTNCWFSFAKNYGVYFNNSTMITSEFSNCHFIGNTYNNIVINGGLNLPVGSFISFDNCISCGCSQGSGLVIHSDVGLTWTGGKIGSYMTNGGNSYGIWMDSKSYSHVYFLGVDLRGNINSSVAGYPGPGKNVVFGYCDRFTG